MAELLTPEAKAQIGRAEPPVRVEVTRRDIVKYAIATEQRQRKYLEGDEAPPMFIYKLFDRLMPLAELNPDGSVPQTSLPELPLKRRMAGGTRLRVHRPIRPGDVLVGTRRIADIYEKAGRQGPLIFIVNEHNITSEDGEPVIDEIQTTIMR